jgi:hypothetical protein
VLALVQPAGIGAKFCAGDGVGEVPALQVPELNLYVGDLHWESQLDGAVVVVVVGDLTSNITLLDCSPESKTPLEFLSMQE